MYAKHKNKKWLLLLDDDTQFPINSLSNYLQGIDEYGKTLPLLVPYLYHKNNKTLISPNYSFLRRGYISKGFKARSTAYSLSGDAQ